MFLLESGIHFHSQLNLHYLLDVQVYALHQLSLQKKDMSNKSEHNRNMIYNAEHWAGEMTVDPSKLEKRMMAVLDRCNIRYEFQKIFYILADNGWIDRFYIADFYIPDKKIIIEVDGKFHDSHRQHDKQRTKDIQRQYPGIEVLRYKWKDLSDTVKMESLLHRIQ